MLVFSNLAISLDGKIASADRLHFNLGTPADRRQMQVLRKRADAILVGASTLRTFQKPMLVRGVKVQPLNVILSSKLEGFSPSWEFFRKPGLPRLLFTHSDTPGARLRTLGKVADIFLLEPRKGVATQIVEELKLRGIKRLLVEGGGQVMWDFVKEGLIDEFHVTLTPWILGGRNSPTLVDGEGFPSGLAQKLKLVRSKRLGNEIYLTYRMPTT